MKTEIYTLETIQEAAQAIRAGELIAFPTETVYGLGARSDESESVEKVYRAKGRPSDNPLIVHVSNQDQVADLVQTINPLSQALMDLYWPGPLTIIFPVKPGAVASSVTGGKSTVALRMPDHPLALALIEAVGIPLVGPSANLSGKPSPTQLDHVLHDFSGKIAGILAADEELTKIGVESTVVFPHDGHVDILRPGYITPEMIHAYLECPVEIISEAHQLANDEVASPGVKYRHYSPQQPVIMVQAPKNLDQWRAILDQMEGKVGLLAWQETIDSLKNHERVVATYSLGQADDLTSATRHIYAGLRYLEGSACQKILVQGLENDKNSTAFMNRLSKASSFVL